MSANNAKAVIFWAVVVTIGFLTTPLFHVPGWVWILRAILAVAGIILTFVLISTDDPNKRDSSAFDYWTFGHATGGLVLGAFGFAFPLVAAITIGWEIFEYIVPGFGDSEIPSNRVVDIAVAWVGWILVAGSIALGTAPASDTAMPWILPSTESVLRSSLHLF